jgi:hypothetical protein
VVLVVGGTALSAEEVDEVWRRWRAGEAVKVHARAMRRHSSTVRDLLKRSCLRVLGWADIYQVVRRDRSLHPRASGEEPGILPGYDVVVAS